MSSLNLAVFSRSAAADESMVGDRAVLYHRPSGKALVLNPTGSFIWSQLRESRTLDQLVAALCAQHASLAEDAARRDIEVFLAELKSHNLLAE
ncbi:MAG: PqqD family protein [Candidatus Sumerlaeaceae bacterium]|nr:PqqD family protein [Candidatus Sumerlaeaceae bacterium]